MDTATSLSLLDALHDPRNDEAWQRFVMRYQPMIVAFAAKCGLNDNDAQDAAQETMTAFVKGYREGAYDRSKGRLRSWLFGIAHRKVIDVQRRMGRERVLADRSDGTAFLQALESPAEAEDVWEQEWQEAVLRECMSEVSRLVDPATFKAFP